MKEIETKMIQLLEEAATEGYNKGCEETTVNIVVNPVDDNDNIPVHNIENWAIQKMLEDMPKEGYVSGSISRIRPFVLMVQEKSKASWTEQLNPYVVYVAGDYLMLECQGEKTQKVLPTYGVFMLYVLLPNKLYTWTVYKNEKVVGTGKFKTIGNVRMIGFDNWTNFRDIGGFGIKHGLVYRGANPDNVVVDSADHERIKLLGITTQLNLRTPSTGSTTEGAWRSDIFSRGLNNDIEDYSTLITKGIKFKKAFEYLVTSLEAGHIVAFNCFAGADRTGTFCFIIQALCGVPAYVCHAFYEMTSLSRWLNTKKWDETEGGDFRKFITKLQSLYGNDPYTQAYRLCTEKIGITKQWIDRLRAVLLEK